MNQDPLILAQRLIKFPSITPIDAGIIDFLISYLKPYGFECSKLVFEDVTNLYARFGSSGPNFCFAGHTDVVPPGDNWGYDPFAAIIDNGKLYGRGASDMKAAIASFITASLEFIQNNKFEGSISFLISGDEEDIAINGTPKVLKYLKDKKEILDACIVGEPTCPNYLGEMIKYGRRGSINFKLNITGKQGHVAYPEFANNPIDVILKILSALKALDLDLGTENFTASHLEITDITVGNKAGNVIPAEAKADFNIRFNNLHNCASLTILVEEICRKYSDNFSLTSNCSAESFVNDKTSHLINNLSDAITQVTSITPILSTTGGTSDARFIKDYCQVIEFGLVNQTAHHKDEHVDCQDIIDLKAIYLTFLKKYFQ